MLRILALLLVIPAVPRFTLVTGEGPRKYLPATMPGGVAVFDADGDGLLDIFFANGGQLPGGPKAPDAFWRNRGGFRFEDQTTAAGLAGKRYAFGAAAADYDGDGRVDLLVTGLDGLTLYRNLGGARFADVTAASGLDNRGRWSTGAVWFDADGDTDLDLFVVNYVRWNAAAEKTCVVEGQPDFCHPKFYEPQPNALFRNNGNGTFTDVSESSGIAQLPGKGMAATAADLDADGDIDLFVTNDRQFNFLLRNTGRGRFTEAAFDAGVAAPANGEPPSAMGTAAGDFDNDGRADLVYTALRDETFPFYRNNGALLFEEWTERTGLGVLTRPMAGWGIVWADMDNDGWQDLVLARGEVLSATGSKAAIAKEPLSWLRNDRGQRFTAAPPIAAPKALYRGLAVADLDNDGCLDLVATALNAPAQVLRRTCPPGAHSLQVSGGTRVSVDERWSVTASTSSGYASSCACPRHFGLGPRTTARVKIQHADGRLEDLGPRPAGQIIKAAERPKQP